MEKQEHPLAHKFHQVYANIPIPMRSEIISVVDNEPVSWKIVRLEVNGNTKLSHKILNSLRELEII